MSDMNTIRRALIASITTALAAAAVRTSVAGGNSRAQFAALEQRLGGRIGVMALDTTRGARVGYREEEPFAMCSTFKWLLAAAVLSKADRDGVPLDRPMAYGAGDLLDYAPVTRAHAADGSLPLRTLCEAAVEVSDNTAANLLLRFIGGPAALTQYLRSVGDRVTRLDRTEPTLNENRPGDRRDTTTPQAMVATMRTLLLGETLPAASRESVVGWLTGCTTGRDRLRAGLPAGWSVGDKTGTGSRGAVNDVAIVWPPARRPILIAVFMSGSTASGEVLAAGHAQIGRLVGTAFA